MEKERDSVLGKQDDQRRHRGRDAGSEGQGRKVLSKIEGILIHKKRIKIN